MTPEGSRFLWKREARAGGGPSAGRRILDNLLKQSCGRCLKGELHDRMKCNAAPWWVKHLCGFDFFTREVILTWFPVFTPNTLASILVRCNEEYWVENVTTTLSDPEYDMISQRLEQVCPDHPQLQFVGDYNTKTGYHA